MPGAGWLLWLTLAAAPRTATLEWIRGPGADACPAQRVVEKSITARLGYDPFVPHSPSRIKATVQRDGAAWHGTIELAGRRSEVSSSAADCAELAASMAITITIAIDPLVLSRPPPPDAGTAPPPRRPPPPEPVDAGAPEPEPWDAGAAEPIDAGSAPDAGPAIVEPVNVPDAGLLPARAAPSTWLAGAGLEGSAGIASGLAAGLGAQAAIRFESFSIGLEAHAALAPSQGVGGSHQISNTYYFAQLAACLHPGRAALCALAAGGAMQSQGGGVTQPLSATTPLALAGIRAAYDVPLTERIHLRAHLDVHARLVRVELTIDDNPAWTSGLLSGTLGLSILARF